GVSVGGLRDDVNRPQSYWLFSQRERQTPIDHKGALALRRAQETVSTVFGSVVGSYRITNEVELNATNAFSRAIALLGQLEGVGAQTADRRRETRLVLLPYGAPPDDKVRHAL